MRTRAFGLVMVCGLAAGSATAQEVGVLTGRLPEGQQVTGPVANPDAPRIQFEQMQHEFGRINDQTPVTATFKFTNMGKSTLVLQQPRAGCGCTVPNLEKVEYAPGESGKISVTFNPAGKHGDQTQRVTVPSNDPSQPELTLVLRALVRQTVWFEPPLVSFGEVQAGQKAVQQLKVHGPAPDFKVTYVSSTKGRAFDIKVLETKDVEVDGEKVRQSTVEVSFNGNAPRGTVGALGMARTTLASHQLADFQIIAEVVGDLQVLPPRLNTGVLEPGAEWTRTFRVSSRTGAPFTITKFDQVSNLGEQMKITATPVEGSNGAAYQIELKGKAPNASIPINGIVTMETDSKVDPKIEVVLSGAVRTAAGQPLTAPPELIQKALISASEDAAAGAKAAGLEPAKPANQPAGSAQPK